MCRAICARWRDEKVYAIDWKDKLDVLKNTYYLKVNETEMETITGLKDPTGSRQADSCLGRYPR